MPGSPEPTPSGPTRSRPSRRTVILGAAGAAIVAAGAAGAIAAKSLSGTHPATGPGKLVTPLLASSRFTVAHHAAELDWPEESMFAYRKSVATGVDALEVSVARTSDGIWFALHDATLDRTSGTTGFVASEHTWQEVQQYQISAAATSDPAQPKQPYTRFVDVLDAYGDTHALFVDPKVVPASRFPELMDLIEKHVTNPRESIVAKGYCTQTTWGAFARKRGLETWGFYYGNEITGASDLLSSTQENWSTIGLNYTATDAEWSQVRALGKTLVGHVLPSSASVDTSLAHGATGLMISSLKSTMSHLSPSSRPSAGQ